MKESKIQRGILDYLELFSRNNDLYFFRAGSGAMRTEAGRYFKTGRPGCPDIVCCHKGQFIGLEVKTEKGRQSQSQIKTEAQIKCSGGQYYIVRSIADVKRVLPL